MKLKKIFLATKIVRLIAILIALIAYLKTSAQDTAVLRLPINHGNISKQKIFLSINENNGIYIGCGKDSLVKACETGTVIYVRKTSNGQYILSIKTIDGIVFNYSKLLSVTAKKGQIVFKESVLGYINERTPLFFSVLKHNNLQNPKKYLEFY